MKDTGHVAAISQAPFCGTKPEFYVTRRHHYSKFLIYSLLIPQ